MMTIEAVAEETGAVSEIVRNIVGMLKHSNVLTRGDFAALRRMDPRQPSAAFFKIEGLVLDPLLPGDAAARADLETKWAAIIAGLALLGDLYRPDQRLGFALVTADFSELRFARLVRADSERLIDELPLLARFLVAKGIPADWTAAAQLMLSAGKTNEESVRRHLARDYYGALAREEHG